jgi:hypothetical protein
MIVDSRKTCTVVKIGGLCGLRSPEKANSLISQIEFQNVLSEFLSYLQ